MIGIINYNEEDRIAIVLPKKYATIGDGIEFGKSLFEAVEVIASCNETKELINSRDFLNIVQLAQIASNLV